MMIGAARAATWRTRVAVRGVSAGSRRPLVDEFANAPSGRREPAEVLTQRQANHKPKGRPKPAAVIGRQSMAKLKPQPAQKASLARPVRMNRKKVPSLVKRQSKVPLTGRRHCPPIRVRPRR